MSEILNRPFPNFKIISTPKILWNPILCEEFSALKNILLWRCLMTRMAFSTLNIYPKFYQVLPQPDIRKHFRKPKIIPCLYATFKLRFIFHRMIVSYYFTTSMASSWLVALSAFWTNYSFSKISPFFLFALLHTFNQKLSLLKPFHPEDKINDILVSTFIYLSLSDHIWCYREST